jgi:phytoene/squalene synthetase
MTSTLSPNAQTVHRLDRDRFVTALFIPEPVRETVMALYAFNIELAKIRESIREPMAGMIRLQWWRDILAGSRPDEAVRHPVAGPLCRLGLPEGEIEAMLAAREKDFEPAPFATPEALTAYAADTAGCLAQWACRILGGGDESTQRAARLAGTGYGLTGVVRAIPFHLGSGWVTVPGGVVGDKPRMIAALAPVALRARQLLDEARAIKVRRPVLPALLPASLASAHLAQLAAAGGDPFDARVSRLRTYPVRLLLQSWRGRF